MNAIKNLLHGHHDEKTNKEAVDHHGHGISATTDSTVDNDAAKTYTPRHINPADLPPPPTETIKDQAHMTGRGHTAPASTEKGAGLGSHRSDEYQGEVTDNTRDSSGRDARHGAGSLNSSTTASTGGANYSGRDNVGSSGTDGYSGRDNIGSMGYTGHTGHNTAGTTSQNTSGNNGHYSTWTAPLLNPDLNPNGPKLEDASVHDKVTGGGGETADLAHGGHSNSRV